MKKIITVLLLVVGMVISAKYYESGREKKQQQKVEQNYNDKNIYSIKEAYDRHLDRVQVTGKGTIVKLLRDDTNGIRHQKFLVGINSSTDERATILISHNIDIAPKIPDIVIKTPVEFSGEYIWNEKGGLVHWTHHDPRSKHKNGWIKYKNKTYQ